MRTKPWFIGTIVVALLLAAGCGTPNSARTRQEARNRWGVSRAEMVTKLAEGAFDRGEIGRARQEINEIAKENIPYAPLYILAARLAAEAGELDTAKLYAASAETIDPKSADARYVRGTIEQTLGQTDRALEAFAEAARLQPAEPKYTLAYIEMLVARGEAETAVKTLQDATVRMPGRAEVYVALGDVLTALGRHGEAVGAYRIARRLDPQRDGLEERLAVGLFFSGAYAEAEPLLADLAEPASPVGGSKVPVSATWIVRMRTDCLMALGRIEEARRLFETQSRADPRRADVVALLGLAKCDLLQQRLDEARTHLEAVLQHQPRHSEANALMGYVLLATGRADEALMHLRLALQDPNCADRATVERLFVQAGGREADNQLEPYPKTAMPIPQDQRPDTTGKDANVS